MDRAETERPYLKNCMITTLVYKRLFFLCCCFYQDFIQNSGSEGCCFLTIFKADGLESGFILRCTSVAPKTRLLSIFIVFVKLNQIIN